GDGPRVHLPEADLLPGARAPHPARPGTGTTTGLDEFEANRTCWSGGAWARTGARLVWCGVELSTSWCGLAWCVPRGGRPPGARVGWPGEQGP
ncbi:hypothetical protein LCGC14_2522530, partial [marine sediment metagenome]